MTEKREFKKFSPTGHGAAFSVRVVTRTSKSEIVGAQDDGIIKVRLTGSPDDGSANKELLELLSKVLGVQHSQVEIVAGENSRDKLISLDGVTPEELEQKLQTLGNADDNS